jgi:hypothetical protein
MYLGYQRHDGVDIGLQQLAQPAEIRRVSGMRIVRSSIMTAPARSSMEQI